MESPVTAAYASAAAVSMPTSTTPWASARKPMSRPTLTPPIVRGKVIGMNTIDCQALVLASFQGGVGSRAAVADHHGHGRQDECGTASGGQGSRREAQDMQ